jgi:ADP-ribose pyrophosphatase YjhB (NUDIX family)
MADVGARAAGDCPDGRLLMVRERHDNRWALPGGWADVHQTPRENIEREVREESGYECKVRKLAAVWDRNRHGHPPQPFFAYKMFFLCELAGGAAQPSIETTEIAFFAEAELPDDISMGRVRPHQLKRMFEHYRAPELPTDVD